MTTSWGERHSAAIGDAEAVLQVESPGRTAEAEGNDQPSPRRAELVENVECPSQVAAVAGWVQKERRLSNAERWLQKIEVLQDLRVSKTVFEELVEKRSLDYYSATSLRGALEWLLLKGLSEAGLVKAVSQRLSADLLQGNEDVLRQHGLTDGEILKILELGGFSRRKDLQNVDGFLYFLEQELRREQVLQVLAKGRALSCKSPQNVKAAADWFKRQGFNLARMLAHYPRLLETLRRFWSKICRNLSNCWEGRGPGKCLRNAHELSSLPLPLQVRRFSFTQTSSGEKLRCCWLSRSPRCSA